jgi:hypothetical protein
MARMTVTQVLARPLRAVRDVAGNRAVSNINRTRVPSTIAAGLCAAINAPIASGDFILSGFVNYFTKISPSVLPDRNGNDPALRTERSRNET